MKKLVETTFGNVVLGAYVQKNQQGGQKIDEPIREGRNKHGQSSNVAWSGNGNPSNLQPDDLVRTPIYSQKDKPELRSQ